VSKFELEPDHGEGSRESNFQAAAEMHYLYKMQLLSHIDIELRNFNMAGFHLQIGPGREIQMIVC
jgi:hypothetical protein